MSNHKCLALPVFQTDPDLIREGGTIPVARTFQDVTGKSIIMLPIGGFDDGLHSQNEKISRLALQRERWIPECLHASL